MAKLTNNFTIQEFNSISITSGYRSPQHNKKIGGESGKMKQGGIGIYPSWVHYDIFFGGKNKSKMVI
jgi:uncharacterized protein YcbK (DUF882 family)